MDFTLYDRLVAEIENYSPGLVDGARSFNRLNLFHGNGSYDSRERHNFFDSIAKFNHAIRYGGKIILKPDFPLTDNWPSVSNKGNIPESPDGYKFIQLYEYLKRRGFEGTPTTDRIEIALYVPRRIAVFYREDIGDGELVIRRPECDSMVCTVRLIDHVTVGF